MNQIDEIVHLIELSVAPVFLLTGVDTLLNVLSGRFARIMDRACECNMRLANSTAMTATTANALSETVRPTLMAVWTPRAGASP